MVIEFVPVSPPSATLDVTSTFILDLPTAWMLHVLPRLGPTPFLLYLALLAREPATPGPASISFGNLAVTLDLWSRIGVWWNLLWLRLFGLVATHPRDGGLVVRDPEPLTHVQRWVLTQRERGRWPRSRPRALAGLMMLAAGLVALHWFLTRLP